MNKEVVVGNETYTVDMTKHGEVFIKMDGKDTLSFILDVRKRDGGFIIDDIDVDGVTVNVESMNKVAIKEAIYRDLIFKKEFIKRHILIELVKRNGVRQNRNSEGIISDKLTIDYDLLHSVKDWYITLNTNLKELILYAVTEMQTENLIDIRVV